MTSQIAMSSFKLLLVGDEGVGKSTYIHNLRTGKFEEWYYSTHCVAYGLISLNKVTFQINDYSGKDIYKKKLD